MVSEDELKEKEILSILESVLFISKDPIKTNDLSCLFNKKFSNKKIDSFMQKLKIKYEEDAERGIYLESINKGYQLRSKAKNKDYLLKIVKEKPFRLSKPAMEVLSIIAYHQPCTKQEIDQIRNIDSGHTLRLLIEKNLVLFAGKNNDVVGKPSLYKTSDTFLEVFGLKTLEDLPSEEEIQELLPKTSVDMKKESLEEVSENLDMKDPNIPETEDEKENEKLKEKLTSIPHSVTFLDEKNK